MFVHALNGNVNKHYKEDTIKWCLEVPAITFMIFAQIFLFAHAVLTKEHKLRK